MRIIEIHRLKDFVDGKPAALSVRLPVKVTSGTHWSSQELGFEQLGGGEYVIELRLEVPGSDLEVSRAVRVELK